MKLGSPEAMKLEPLWPKQDEADDKGEQCVYCGKDSWTCEHFERPTHEDIEDARREAMLDAQVDYEMQLESEDE